MLVVVGVEAGRLNRGFYPLFSLHGNGSQGRFPNSIPRCMGNKKWQACLLPAQSSQPMQGIWWGAFVPPGQLGLLGITISHVSEFSVCDQKMRVTMWAWPSLSVFWMDFPLRWINQVSNMPPNAQIPAVTCHSTRVGQYSTNSPRGVGMKPGTIRPSPLSNHIPSRARIYPLFHRQTVSNAPHFKARPHQTQLLQIPSPPP